MFANQHPSSKSNPAQLGIAAHQTESSKEEQNAVPWLFRSQDTCKCQPPNTLFTFGLTTIVQCEYMPGRAPGSGEALLCVACAKRHLSECGPYIPKQTKWIINDQTSVNTSLDARAAWNNPYYNACLGGRRSLRQYGMRYPLHLLKGRRQSLMQMCIFLLISTYLHCFISQEPASASYGLFDGNSQEESRRSEYQRTLTARHENKLLQHIPEQLMFGASALLLGSAPEAQTESVPEAL